MTTTTDTERLIMLAERLATATATRTAEWQVADADVFTWSSARGSVRVASRDRDGEPPYELTVYNDDGQKVDQLTSELLDDDQPAPWNDTLVELYRIARRSALRADDIIEALMAELPSSDGEDEPERERSFLSRARRYTAPQDEWGGGT
jgi:hypothetical protein